MKSFVRLVFTGNRRDVLRKTSNYLYLIQGQDPPTKQLVELFPRLRDTERGVRLNNTHLFELPYGERIALACCIAELSPKRVFEFGTYTGATTVTLASLLSDDSEVHTLDLPAEEIVWGQEVRDAIGREIARAGALAKRIHSHRCNSRKFDFGFLARSCELVYIDASHDYEDVLHDSYRALEIVAKGGIIVWDDYQVDCPGVVQAVRELAVSHPVVRIGGTRLAMLRVT